MKLHGMNKLTLLDYPGKTACLVFTGHCDFRCPFCQNAGLVLSPSSEPEISPDEFFNFLKKRKNVLEGVCISGGEPLLNTDIADFIKNIKNMGYFVKLDTNGNHSSRMIGLLEAGLVDYIAMDIKNSKEHYPYTCGIKNFDLKEVERSVEYLLSHSYDYEFRTTVVQEYHSQNDFLSIGKWITGAKAYFLQPYKPSENVLGNLVYSGHPYKEMLTAPSREELEIYCNIVSPYVNSVKIRGI